MPYTDHPGCSSCDCRIMNAQSSGADAPWRSCDCRCHDTAKQIVLRNGPIPKETT